MHILKVVVKTDSTRLLPFDRTEDWQNTETTYTLVADDLTELKLFDEEVRELQGLLAKLFPPTQPAPKLELPEEAKEFARRGKKIDAIKALREFHHLGLKEAKDMVEAWMVANPKPKLVLPEEAKELARTGKKVEAVRVTRDTLGLRLAEALQLVTEFMKVNKYIANYEDHPDYAEYRQSQPDLKEQYDVDNDPCY